MICNGACRRAALTAGLWAIGKEGAAAEQWDRLEDLR
jgi:hypothetical protein